MISQFFVLSPRGDTIISKKYRSDHHNHDGTAGHERSNMEAFFRKVKFWNDDVDDDGINGNNSGGGGTDGDNNRAAGGGSNDDTNNNNNNKDSASGGGGSDDKTSSSSLGDAPPVFLMPDGLTYMHVNVTV